MQQNSTKRVWGKTRFDGESDPLRIGQKLKYDRTTKWHMHKPEPVLENKTHKIFWDFEMQTNYLIPARRPDQVVINERKKIEIELAVLWILPEGDGDRNCN